MMDSDTPVTLRHRPTTSSVAPVEGMSTESEEQEPVVRRLRPKSASYEALRSALYQLTRKADFKVETLLGSGFFADVYKVKHKTTGAAMVLKMNKSRKTSKTMLTEIQLLNRLSHPNILRFKGSCVHEGQLHALTEYINGGSLEEMLMDKSIHLSWSVRLKIAEDIVQGMVYLHSKNVFHRDLNPKNCLIQREKDGQIRTIVADFGLAAKIKQRRRRSHTEAVGSAYWMAPECLYGKNYCEQADVFSFGITLAEIIARIPADPDFMPRTQNYGIDVDALQGMCDDCPEQLLQLVDRCCQIDPDDRPSFEEVLEFLESIHLSDHFLEENEVKESEVKAEKIHASSSEKDLRSSVSEPLLRLEDRCLSLDDDTRSCDSEGEHGQITVRPIRHRQRKFDSIGSSNGSSYDSIVEDDCGSVTDIISGSPELEECDKNSETFADEPLHTNNAGNLVTGTRSTMHDSGSALTGRTQSESTTQGRGEKSCHILLQKSVSLDDDAVKENGLLPLDHLGDLEAGNLEKNPSMQTLVGNDGGGEQQGESGGETVNGRGGDSGIDPGEVDVFKFPPRQESTPSSVEQSAGDLGDHTPICCASPELLHISDSEPHAHISTATHMLLDQHDQTNGHDRKFLSPLLSPTSNHRHLPSQSVSNERDGPSKATGIEGVTNLSPTHSDFSFSRTSSSNVSHLDGVLLITPTERSLSPLGQSWASSEVSFNLPSPSTPWAPPSSPVPPHSRHSLPSSPSYFRHSPYHSPYHHYHHQSQQQHKHPHHHRYSQEIPEIVHPPCLRKTSSQSCRNSALFSSTKPDGNEMEIGLGDGFNVADLQDDFEQMMKLTKTVHFMENHQVEDDDNMSLKMCYTQRRKNNIWSPRERSISNPSGFIRKKSAPTMENQNGNGSLKEYGISLKTDLLDAACSSRHYKIVQTSHTRLSSSAPDLSKLTNSSLHAARC